MTRATRHGTVSLRVAAGVLAGALVAGCGQEPLPQPRPAADPGPVPVVMEVQADAVREQLAAALAAGDQVQDPAPLQSRVTGPALELRQARYTVRRQLPDAPAPPTLTGEPLLRITPAAQAWPRFFLTASQPDSGAVPQVQVLTQAAAREPYRLAAWVSLLPGVTLPETSADPPPESLPAAEASGLVASPADVLARYADVLTRGGESEFAAAFADDAFRGQVLGEQDAERQAVSEFFDYAVNHEPLPEAVWAVRTTDGGAIVLGAMRAQRTFTVTARGARLPLPPDLATLAGTQEATENAAVESLEMVAFAVPPDGSDAPVTVIGGERGAVRATAS